MTCIAVAGVHGQRRILSNRNPHDIGLVHLSPHDLLRAFFCTIPVHNSFLSRMVKFSRQKLSRFRELGLKTSTAIACASRIESKCRSDCAVLSFRFSRSQLCQRTATSSLEKKKGSIISILETSLRVAEGFLVTSPLLEINISHRDAEKAAKPKSVPF